MGVDGGGCWIRDCLLLGVGAAGAAGPEPSFSIDRRSIVAGYRTRSVVLASSLLLMLVRLLFALHQRLPYPALSRHPVEGCCVSASVAKAPSSKQTSNGDGWSSY
jgi:hypothetical protein